MLIVKSTHSTDSHYSHKKPGIAPPSRVFLILSLLFACLAMHSRDRVVIKLHDSLQSSLKGFYVEKVIKACREDSCIGFAMVGGGNKMVPAYLSPSIESALGGHIRRSFPYAPGLKPLIVRINELYVYEISSGTSEISCIELCLSFITRQDSSYIDEYLAAMAFDHSGMDVTHQHAGNINDALQRCFDNFALRMRKGKLMHKPLASSDLGRNPLEHTDEFPIMKVNPIPKTVFRAYSDFREYRPDTLTPFAVTYMRFKRDSLLVQAKISGLEEDSLEHIWGFSDGTNPFIRVGKKFYRMRLKNGEYITRIFMEDAGRVSGAVDAGAVVAAGMIGGLIGGAIVGGIMGAVAANEIGKYKLDFATGKLIIRPIPDYMRIQSTMIFRLSDYSKKDIPLTIYFRDKKLATLKQDDYLKLLVPSGYNSIKLKCVPEGGSGEELEFNLRLFFTDAYLLKVKKNLGIEKFHAIDEVRKSVLDSMTEERTVAVTL